MESREANHGHVPQQQLPSPPPPPPLQPQLPHNLQTATMVLVGPNLFTNSTVQTTRMTPVTAQFPPFNMNINPSPHYYESFNNNINDTVTLPQTAPSTTLMPSMTVVGGSSSVFPSPSDSGSVKRKRGRPRKYFPDGEVNSGSGSGQAHVDVDVVAHAAPPPVVAAIVTSPDDSSVKSTRGRGRPRGSYKQKNEVSGGLAGTCFTPYVIIVNQGEDIVAKLTAACHGGPNSEICILAAHGLVSNVDLHHLGDIATYGGPFEIVSLSGTLVSGNNNGGKRMGSWKVALGGGPNARIWGGVVANKLIAASSVRVILGSFTVDGKKASSSNWNAGPSSAAPSSQFAALGIRNPTGAMSQSQGHSSESSGDNDDNPFIHGPSGVYNNADQPIPNMAMYQQMWARHTQHP